MLRDVANPDREIYIGETQFAHPHIARLAPLAKLVEGRWQPIGDPVAAFPTEGLVFSVDAKLKNRDKGLIVLFTVIRREDNRDHFITDEVCEPFEVVTELEGLPSEEIRRRITREGLHRGLQEESRVIVSLTSETIVMPLIEKDNVTGRWQLSFEQNLEALPVYRKPAGFDGEASIYDRWFAIPGMHAAEQVGAVNWQNDLDFLHSLLRYLRRCGPVMPDGELSQLSKSVIERLITAYRNASLIADGVHENSALLERLAPFLRHLESESEAIDSIARELFGHPKIHTKVAELTHAAIARETAKELERMKDELRVEASAAIADLIERREALGSELAELAARRGDLAEEVARARKTRDDEVEALRNAVHDLGNGTVVAADTIGRILELAREFGVDLPTTHSGRESRSVAATSAAPPAPWARVESAPGAIVVDATELPSKATALAKANGIRSEDLARLDMFARAGDVPVLVGGARERVATAYADLVSGGAIARMPLDPTVLGAEDLWTRAGTPTALAQAWATAEKDPTSLVVVRLDGLDQAGLADWFPTFASLFRDTRPPNLVAFAIGGEKPSREDDASAQRVEIETAFAPGATLAIMERRSISRTRLSLETGSEFDEDELENLAEAVVESDVGPRGAELALARYRTVRAWLSAEQAVAAVLASLRSSVPAVSPQKQPA